VATDQSDPLLRVRGTVREFDFLAPGEAALDVAVVNASEKFAILDLRSEYARSRPDAGVSSGAIEMPLDLLDLMAFCCTEVGRELEKEERTSEVRRRRNSLEEGALFKSLEDLIVLRPGEGLGIPTIVWSGDPSISLQGWVGEIEVRFTAPVLFLDPEDMEASVLAGDRAAQRANWLAREFRVVALVARVPVGR
jgi:hypothetical protein